MQGMFASFETSSYGLDLGGTGGFSHKMGSDVPSLRAGTWVRLTRAALTERCPHTARLGDSFAEDGDLR